MPSSSSSSRPSLVKEIAVKLSNQRHPQCCTGFLFIQDYLDELQFLRTAVMSGCPISVSLEELRNSPAVLRKKKPSRQTDPEETMYIHGGTNSKASVMELCKQRRKTLSQLLQMDIWEPDDRENLKKVYIKNVEHMMEKLETIYRLLTGIIQMRNKDLKSMKILEQDYVTSLMTEPPLEKKKMSTASLPPVLKKRHYSEPLLEVIADSPGGTWESMFAPKEEHRRSSARKSIFDKLFESGLRKTSTVKEITPEGRYLPPWLASLQDSICLQHIIPTQ
ncbi:uncharacterized protein O3C94_007102 [Discoglossus pictus]